jgi:hypothetical protein
MFDSILKFEAIPERAHMDVRLSLEHILSKYNTFIAMYTFYFGGPYYPRVPNLCVATKIFKVFDRNQIDQPVKYHGLNGQ